MGETSTLTERCENQTSTSGSLSSGRFRRTERDFNKDPFCHWGFNDQVPFEVWSAMAVHGLFCRKRRTRPLPGLSNSTLLCSPEVTLESAASAHTHPLPCPCLGRFNSRTKAEGCLSCPPGFHPASGTPLLAPSARGRWVALTCIPGTGVTLLGPAQPPLVPGVCKVDDQHQLDEDEEEGSHDAKVEPD